MTRDRALPFTMRAAMAMTVVVVLGTAGCMTGLQPGPSRSPTEMAKATDPMIDPATSTCEAFGCAP